jgi:hypothetical protein
MAYCITLRSRNERRITGWYDGSHSRWSTDHRRQKIFERKCDAKQGCHELRQLCPRNANLINIEPRRAIFDVQSWLPWVLTLSAVLVGTWTGVTRYRRFSEVDFRRAVLIPLIVRSPSGGCRMVIRLRR